MKRFLIIMSIFVLVFAFAGTDMLFAKLDHNTNFSAKYMRTLSRNGGMDGSDISHYNPAGTAFMKDGLYVEVDNQSYLKEYSHKTASGTEYKEDKSVPVFPTAFVVFKQQQFAGFINLTWPAGGGVVEYDDTFMHAIAGSAVSAEGKFATMALTFGGAYAINQMISVSLAGRYVSVDNSGKFMAGTYMFQDVTMKGTGWTGVIGVDVKPMNELNIGIRYELNTGVEIEKKIKNGPAWAGFSAPYNAYANTSYTYKYNHDVPAILALGADYKIDNNMAVSLSVHYFFNSMATWDEYENNYSMASGQNMGKNYVNGTSGDTYMDKVEDGYEIGLGFAYKMMANLELSAGYLYTKTGQNKYTVAYDSKFLAASLDAQTFGLGVGYEAIPGLVINFAVSKTFYKEAEGTKSVFGSTFVNKYNKDVTDIALGVEYKIF
jgi:long-chain fatty acid transport protein